MYPILSRPSRGRAPERYREGVGISRRGALIAGVAGATGAALAVGAQDADAAYRAGQPLSFYGGYASLLPPDPTQPLAHNLRIVWRANVSAQALALTFDDGPRPNWTPRVLDALERAGVKATFFCRGDRVAKFGALHKNGPHELGNHTWSHPDLGRLDFAHVHDQLRRTSDVMAETYGHKPTLFRPPYGHVGGAALIAAASLDMTTIAWSGQFRESRFHVNPDGIIDDAVSLVHPGAIFLGHDAGPSERLIAIDRLGAVIGRLKDAGWSFHTVSELLALETATTSDA